MTPDILARRAMSLNFQRLNLSQVQWRRIEQVMIALACRTAEEEREACAALCDAAEQRNIHESGENTAPEDLAREIRARGKVGEKSEF